VDDDTSPPSDSGWMNGFRRESANTASRGIRRGQEWSSPTRNLGCLGVPGLRRRRHFRKRQRAPTSGAPTFHFSDIKDNLGNPPRSFEGRDIWCNTGEFNICWNFKKNKFMASYCFDFNLSFDLIRINK